MTSNADEHIRPSRVLSASGPAWLIYALIFVIVIALGCGVWYVAAPKSMARLIEQLNQEPLKIDSLGLVIGRHAVELPPNGAIEIHPGQPFRIAKLNSNRWQNYNLRLTSPDIDISAITGDLMSATRDMLPDELFENTREIHITIMDGDVEAADFKILSRYSVLDFVARGDATDDPEAKAGSYQKAYQLDPGSELIRNKLISALAELAKTQGAQAASIYESLISQDGPNEEMLRQLADIYELENKNDRLIDILNQLIEQTKGAPEGGGSDRPYRRRLADTLARTGRPQEATAIYEKLLIGASSQDRVATLRQLVAIYRQSRDSEHEIDALKRLVEIAPSDQAPAILTEIALLYEQTEDSAGRLSAWKTLAEKLPDGEPKANIYKIIGRILVGEEKYAQARDSYQAALKIKPNDTNTIINLARLAILENNSAAYIQNLNKLVALEPDNLEYRRELADALATAKQNAKAKDQYQRILARTPEDQNLRLVFIEFLDKIGDKKTLIQEYGELAARSPRNKVPLYNIGVIQFELKDWNKAIESFKKVLAIDSQDNEAREYLLVAYQRKNQKDNIINEALELYKRDPSKTVYRTLMLNTCENAEDWASFAKVAQAITTVEPNSPFGWQQLHKAQINLGQKEPAAESLWQIATKTDDKKAEAWLETARAFTALGKKDRAKEAYQKTLEADPKNQQATQALAELNL